MGLPVFSQFPRSRFPVPGSRFPVPVSGIRFPFPFSGFRFRFRSFVRSSVRSVRSGPFRSGSVSGSGPFRSGSVPFRSSWSILVRLILLVLFCGPFDLVDPILLDQVFGVGRTGVYGRFFDRLGLFGRSIGVLSVGRSVF